MHITATLISGRQKARYSVGRMLYTRGRLKPKRICESHWVKCASQQAEFTLGPGKGFLMATNVALLLLLLVTTFQKSPKALSIRNDDRN